MNSKRIQTIVIFLAIFASANTILAVYSQSQSSGPACYNPPCPSQSPVTFYSILSIPISTVSWIAFSIAALAWRRSSTNIIRFSMMKAGFDRSVYDLMVKMRGSGSRLSLLQSLNQASRHRNELSEMTRIDRKEVDREIGLLEKHGFVTVETQAGPIKIYRLTGHGRSLVRLMDELRK